MRAPRDETLPRLREQQGQTDPPERIAAQVIRDLPTSPPLSPAALARIAAAISARGLSNKPRSSFRWAVALTSLVLGAATLAFAQHPDALPGWLARLIGVNTEMPPMSRPLPKLPKPQTPEVVPLPVAPVPPREARSATAAPSNHRPSTLSKSRALGNTESGSKFRNRAEQNLALPNETTEAPVSSQSALPDRVPSPPAGQIQQLALVERQETVPSASVFASPPPQPRPASLDVQHATRHFSEAVRALRIEHSPKTALAILDRYQTELSAHAFSHETLLLRVEAMLALGLRQEVLRLLDRSSLADVAASEALLTTRGELRAAANRCSDALRDFDQVLAQGRRPPKAALWGRARCREKLGDTAGADADLERFHREFPADPRGRSLHKSAPALPAHP